MTADEPNEGLRTPAPKPILGRIAVVGPCAAGKSVLVQALERAGYDARSCAQEHSYIPDMWRRLSCPQVLIYLDASLPCILGRRSMWYADGMIRAQRERLAHARAHCHLYVHTDALTEAGVLRRVLEGLRALGVPPSGALA